MAALGPLADTGCLLIGEKGVWLSTDDLGKHHCIALQGEERAVDAERHAACEAVPVKLPRAKSQQHEFLDAAREGKRPYSDIDAVSPLMEGVLLGCVAQRVAGRLAWNSRKGRITNNPEANGLVAPVLRAGWSFPK